MLGVAHKSRRGRIPDWFVAGVLAFACAHALAAARSLRFEHVGLEQGLSQESVLTILQDRQGFMWFGTQAGLNRYDGYKVTVFRNNPADRSSLVDNYVMASYEDGAGRLWFGTKGGLTRYDPAAQVFVRYPAPPSTGASTNPSVLSIVDDRAGGMWLGTADGLKHFNPATNAFREYRHDARQSASLSDDRVNAVALDAQGGLWVGTGDGVDRLAPGTGEFVHYRVGRGAAERKRNNVLSLSMGPHATLWVGTASGLEAWRIGGGEPERRHFSAVADGIGDERILALYHDSGANLWVGTDLDGLKWREPSSGKFTTYTRLTLDRHSLSDSQVGSVLVDRTGTLWVGTQFGGLNRSDLASGGFRRLSHDPDIKDGLGSDKARVLLADDKGKLWVGTAGGGLAHLDPATGRGEVFRHDRTPGSLPDDAVTALAADGARLWVGSATGLSWLDLDRHTFHPFALRGEANASFVQEMATTPDGTLWVITRGGIHAIDPSRRQVRSWRHDPNDPSSLGENYGFTVLVDRAGRLWFGTDNGLEQFDQASGKFTHYRHDPADPHSLPHSRIYDLYEAKNRAIWVSTAGGLARMDVALDGRARFKAFPISASAAPGPVGATLEDDSGRLWLSSTVGLTRLDPATGQFKNYTAKNGLIDGSYFVGSAARSADGTLFFGGVNGVTWFMPSDIRANPFPPVVVLTDFLVFNKSRPLGNGEVRHVTLAPRDTVFSLEFAALHYADPSSNRYAYRLRGFDQGWVDTDAGKRFASYTNLDPGDYVFEVRASNKDGVWSNTPATLAITLAPPFWKTWWFRTLVAGLVMSLGLASYHWRIRALLQQKSRLERLVGARTAELVKQKEAAEHQKLEVEKQKDVVEVAHRNISLLSEIGRDLTANLHSETIMVTLYNHVNELMDASVFGIGVYRPERREIDMPFAMERGVRYEPYSRSMDEPNQLAVWCIEHRSEVFINDLEQEYSAYIDNLELTTGSASMGLLSDGSLPTAPRSLMYVPIMAGERVLGVISVHSYHVHAYQGIHLDMLRTLAAYVGVAFDNADAYRRLKDTQTQLAAHEKLASLGSLVAGVAHELNTPIGNSLLLAGTLEHQTEEIAAGFDAGSLRKSELAAFIAASQEGAQLIMRSLDNAAQLVNSFKQVAIDQASAQRRRFDLAQACSEMAATMMNQVRLAGHSLQLELPPGIAMDSYPGPLGQVILNFISNALLHAFDAPGGKMTLRASLADGERVQIVFSDDGHGIAAEHIARIFDPFFTTRMGQGGSGLGLNIAYNIVTSLLGGEIRVDSAPGQGTRFYLDLPLHAAGPSSEGSA